MDPLQVLADTQDYFTRGDALRAGWDDNAIRRALKARTWVRVRQGVYTFPDIWSRLDEAGRHLAVARAVVRKLGPAVALSHVSAAIDHGLVVWGADLSTVHVTRLDGGAGRTEAGVQHHEGVCLSDDLVPREGYLATTPARAAVEAGLGRSAEAALVTFDDGLHQGLFDRADLDRVFGIMSFWPEARPLQVAVRMADGAAESVGESRARYLCYAHGLPAPELQFHVYDAHGVLVGITDMVWRAHRLLGEFDGRVKYGRLLRPGEEPGDAVFREKVREDALREVTGFSMVRITWSDLGRGAQTAARIRQMLNRAA